MSEVAVLDAPAGTAGIWEEPKPEVHGRRSVEVSVNSIITPQLLLRDAQTEDEKYVALEMSIKRHGVRFPLVVTPGVQPHTYILSDGTQRLSIVKKLGFATVPVIVENMSESDSYLTQMEMNLTKVEVTIGQQSAFLIKFATKYPECSQKQLADRIGQPVSWVKDRLKFSKLSDIVQKAADEGSISLSRAIMLTGLEKDQQEKLIEQSLGLEQAAFADLVGATKREVAKAKAAGRAVGTVEYIHSFGSRPKADLIEVLESSDRIASLITGATTPLEGATLLLRWALKDDDASRAAGKAKFDEDAKAAAEKRARKDAEKAAKQAQATAAATDATRG